MKMESQTLKDRPKIQVSLNRDSVCAGDDCESHQKTIEVYSFVDPSIFVREISSDYLPSVTGVGHSWTCVLNGVQMAEIVCSGIRALVPESPFAEENHVHFTYHPAKY